MNYNTIYKSALMQENFESGYYELVSRKILGTSNLFKIKPLGENQILFSAPNNKALATISLSLDSIIRVIQIKDKPLAIDTFNILDKKYIATGCYNGSIYIIPYHASGHQFELKPDTPQETFVNDIINFDSSILVNCYNNGNIGVWGITSGNRLHTFPKIHSRFTYKIRNGPKSSLISCGSDGVVALTDLTRLCRKGTYYHNDPIWCAQKITENTIATVGLTPRISIWDVRVNRIVQFCNLDGFQSSFVTPRYDHLLYFGRNNYMMQWDRRKLQSEKLSNQFFLQSVQCIHLHDGGLIACGRGTDISAFKPVSELREFEAEEEYEKTSKLSLVPHEQTDSSSLWEMQLEIEDEDDEDEEMQEQTPVSEMIDESDEELMIESAQSSSIQNKHQKQKSRPQTSTSIKHLKQFYIKNDKFPQEFIEEFQKVERIWEIRDKTHGSRFRKVLNQDKQQLEKSEAMIKNLPNMIEMYNSEEKSSKKQEEEGQQILLENQIQNQEIMEEKQTEKQGQIDIELKKTDLMDQNYQQDGQ